MNGALQEAQTLQPSYDSASHIDAYQHFQQLYAGQGGPTFKTYHEAFLFGKRVAFQLGFQIRVKTTGYNHKEGIIYKYIACKRQGNPELRTNKNQGQTRSTAALSSASKSSRCGCRWNARLVGLRQPYADANVDLKHVPDHAEGFSWYWCPGERFFEHNHPLGPAELESILIQQPTAATSTSRRSSSIATSVKVCTSDTASSTVAETTTLPPPPLMIMEPAITSQVGRVHRDLHVDMVWRLVRSTNVGPPATKLT